MSSVLPDIPRLYTALAEWLACLLFLLTRRRRFGGAATAALSAGVLALLAVFLQATGDAPLVLWFPCMVVAILLMYGYLYAGCALDAFAAGYCCAQAFFCVDVVQVSDVRVFFAGNDDIGVGKNRMMISHMVDHNIQNHFQTCRVEGTAQLSQRSSARNTAGRGEVLRHHPLRALPGSALRADRGRG